MHFLCHAFFYGGFMGQQERSSSGQTVRSVFRSYLLRFVFWVLLILIGFSILPSAAGIWDKLISGSGMLAIVIGLAAQASLGNVFCGLMIMANHPYEIGDRIEIGNDTGYVTGITLQYTMLRTYLNESIVIPNTIVSGSRIKNYSRISGASYPIEISVAYGTNLEKAKSIMQNVVFHNIRFFGDSKPTVLVKAAGDFGITLKVVIMTKTPEDNPVACSECLQQIISEFTKEGIEIPYPTHVVYQKDVLKSEEEHGAGRKHHN